MGEDAARLAVLEARAAIADLIHTYAQNVRDGRGEACADLFTEDANFEVRRALSFDAEVFEVSAQASGRAAIGTYVAKSSAPGARVCPLISNLLISVEQQGAESRCVMTTLVLATGQQIIGEYHDRYQYEGRWLFASRVFTMVGSADQGRV